jgi:RNA polymerase sigma-70 factor, ECF subfamily
MGDGCRCAAPAVPRQSPPMSDHLTRLFCLARALCGSRGRAEELTHEVYARVLAAPRATGPAEAASGPARPGAEPAFGALASALLDVLAVERDRQLPDEPIVLAGEIYAAVADLPAELRDTVALVDVAGMSYAETARVLRVPQTTVMTRLHRARTCLARALARAA